MKKCIALLLALVMVLGLLAACSDTQSGTDDTGSSGSGASTETSASSHNAVACSDEPLVIEWDQANGTERFEPPYRDDSLSYHTHFLWSNLYYIDGSKEQDDPSRYVWNLATNIEMDDAGLVCTITIRDDAVWDDGEPVTADDVAFSIMAAIMDPISTSKGAWQHVKGYDELTSGMSEELPGMTVEGNTVTLELVEPRADFCPNPWILPEHCFEGVGWGDLSTCDYWNKPVGCGPYKITEVNFPDSFKMTRSETYYGKPAGIKDVVAISYETAGPEAAVAAVISGEVDITTRVLTTDNSITAADITRQNSDCVSVAMYSDKIRSFMFNMGKRPDGNDKTILLESREARQAISLLIDEEAIAAHCASDACVVVGHPNNRYTDHSMDAAHKSLNIQRARELLDAAGWDYETTIDIADYYGDELTKEIMDIIKADAAKAGVKVNYTPIIAGEPWNNPDYSNWDLLYFEARNTDENPAAALGKLASDQWYSMLSNATWVPEKYAPLAAAVDAAEVGSVAYKEAIATIQNANYEDCIIIPVFVKADVIVYNAKNLYIPDTAFDYYDNCLDLDQWISLGVIYTS